MKKSLQERLSHYLIARPHQKIAKGFLADMARAKMGVTGETVGRRLRILAEVTDMHPASAPTPEHRRAIELLAGGRVEVEHRGKQHCWYWYVPPAAGADRAGVWGEGREVIGLIQNP